MSAATPERPSRPTSVRSSRSFTNMPSAPNKETETQLDISVTTLKHNFIIYFERLMFELTHRHLFEDLGNYLYQVDENSTAMAKKFGLDPDEWSEVMKVNKKMRARKFMWQQDEDEEEDKQLYAKVSLKRDVDILEGAIANYKKINRKILTKGIKFNPSVLSLVKMFGLSHGQKILMQFLFDFEIALESRMYRAEYTHLFCTYEIKPLFKQNLYEVIRILVGNVTRKEIEQLADIGLIFKANTESSDLLRGHLNLDGFSYTPYWPLIERIYIRLVLENKTLTFNSIVSYFQNKFKKKLTYADFKNQDHINIIEKLVNQSLVEKSEGINILLYGLPGTGKTETVHALAEHHGWKLIVIGENDDQEPAERLQDLVFAQAFFKNFKNQKIVFLFDEMEDILNIKREHMSKNKINRILENSPFPIFWTTNYVDYFEQSLVRRMTYAHMFEIPTKAKRKEIWHKFVDLNKVDLDAATIAEFSDNYHSAPSVISNVSEVAGKARLQKKETTKVIEGLLTAYNGGKKPKVNKDPYAGEFIPYDFALANTDTNLETAMERLRNSKNPNWNMCLFGAPGTGKSAYARHLAKVMGIKIIYKRASDLISMWVGETEKNIAAAFHEAEEDGALLVFDEADSFLQSRAGARNSWEVTAVNEMLTHMENSKTPFICTTNLLDNLDEAALRRFVFKVKFDWMTTEQITHAFKQFFNVEVAVPKHWRLSPGDFVSVKKRTNILGTVNKDEVFKLMEQEFKLKKLDGSKPIGFGK